MKCYQEEVNNHFLSLSKDSSNFDLMFQGKVDKNRFFKMSATVNRYDDLNNPEKVMGMIEDINKDTFDFESSTETFKKYQLFREIMSRSNTLEFHVNLKMVK